MSTFVSHSRLMPWRNLLKLDSFYHLFFFSCLTVVITSIFQGMALEVSAYPLVPVVFFQCIFLSFFAVESIVSGKVIIAKQSIDVYKTLTYFLLYAGATSVLLTLVFEGTPVYSPKGGIDDQVDIQSLLLFSGSNIGQCIYLVLNVGCFAGIARISMVVGPVRILQIWIISGTLAAFFAIYEKISQIYSIPYPIEILKSNSIYSQAIDVKIGEFERVSGTFTEASYAGNCIATFFVFYLSLIVLDKFRVKNYLLCCFFLVATLLTTSSIGYIQIVFGLAVIPILIGKKGIGFAISFALILILLGGAVIVSDNPLVALVLLDKSESLSFLNRISSDIFALQLLVDTNFLGVGLGSNRPSSFLTYMLSNVGLIGTILFGLFFYRIVRFSGKQVISTAYPEKTAMIAALFSHILGKIAGSPDLNFWFFWVTLGVSFSVLSGHQSRFTRSAIIKRPRTLK